jgi:hypothetical protein
MKQKGIAPIVIVLIVAAVLAAGGAFWYFVARPEQSVPAAKQNGGTPAGFSGEGAIDRSVNLNDVLKSYDLKLSQAQADYLEKNKFLLLPLKQPEGDRYSFDSMLAYFDRIGGANDEYYRRPENARLITPDVVLHTYHKYFDLTLTELEETVLSEKLGVFLSALSENIIRAARSAGPDAAARYDQILAQMTVARVLFENKGALRPDFFTDHSAEEAYRKNDQTADTFEHAKGVLKKYSSFLPSDLESAVLREIELIYSANDVAISPLWGQYSVGRPSDYTQFTPRSHYTKNSALRAYFRTMMYLGRNGYLFSKDIGIKDALLVANVFAVKDKDGGAPIDLWKQITDITEFYVGKSDDITYDEWKEYLNGTIGGGLSAQEMMSSETINKIMNGIDRLRGPKIFSDVVIDPNIGSKTKADLLRESLSFRIFGQKFTFDAWVLNDLTAGQELTEVRLPSMPSALFIPAALGDARAREHVATLLEKERGFEPGDVRGFMGKLEEKAGQLKRITPSEWFSALGSAWIDVLSTLTGQYGDAYPAYMRSPNFPDKQIQTFLGSYTELKHDTLLYAKQSYAELGGGESENLPLPPVVKGFVEPNLAFWQKIIDLAQRTEQFFDINGIFQKHTALERLTEFKKILLFYQSLAKKEFDGTVITDDEYERLRTQKLSFVAEPFEAAESPDADSGKTALVADVHTDMLSNEILYEGTGIPYLMLAYVDNENSPRLTVGLASNHYEFTKPIAKRVTDEDWKKSVYDDQSSLPEKNFWYRSLLVQ